MKLTQSIIFALICILALECITSIKRTIRKKAKTKKLNDQCYMVSDEGNYGQPTFIEDACKPELLSNLKGMEENLVQKIFDCVRPYDHIDKIILEAIESKNKAVTTNEVIPGEIQKESIKKCNSKNRFTNIYSYSAGVLLNDNEVDDTNYINSATYKKEIIDSTNEVINFDIKHQIKPKKDEKGLVIATNAPIGFTNDIKNFIGLDNDKTNAILKGCEVFHNGPYNPKCFSRSYTTDDASKKKDNTIFRFYETLKEKKIDFVVMLTDFIDDGNKGKTQTPCQCAMKADKYFPLTKYDGKTDMELNLSGIIDPANQDATNENENIPKDAATHKVSAKDITTYKVSSKGEADYENNKKTFLDEIAQNERISVRKLTFDVLNPAKPSVTAHSVVHIHYKAWPDNGVPTDAKDLKHFQEMVKFFNKYTVQDKKINVIVHCTGGVGRTGTLISSILAYGLGTANPTKKFSLANYIFELRKLRPYFVETPEQLVLLRNALFEFK